MGFFEPLLSSLSVKLALSRKKTATLLCIVGGTVSLILTNGICSYLIEIIDLFVNELGILLLIGIQCIIFAWAYGLKNILPTLNEYSSFKVGKTWMFIIKYLLPVVLIIMWVMGVFNLLLSEQTFEIIVDPDIPFVGIPVHEIEPDIITALSQAHMALALIGRIAGEIARKLGERLVRRSHAGGAQQAELIVAGKSLAYPKHRRNGLRIIVERPQFRRADAFHII